MIEAGFDYTTLVILMIVALIIVLDI